MNGTAQAWSARASFRARAEFDAYFAARPELCSDACEHVIITHCLRHGVLSRFFGLIPANEIGVVGPEAQEHLMARQMNPRQRACLDLLAEWLAERGLADMDAVIYGHEAITPAALALRGRFPRYLGSEFAATEAERQNLFPIRHGDICNSDLPSAAFDAIVSNGVLEHVPDIDAALRESVRLLKPGGTAFVTIPFHFWLDKSERFAYVRNGKIVHLTEAPIYHGDPMRAEGCLVYELPAWDFLDRARRAGFADARMEFICDQAAGIVASSLAMPLRPRGVLVGVLVR
jgi:SAM-dependent methyltransferase